MPRTEVTVSVTDTEAFKQMAAEHERFRKALVRIANAQSGHWGVISHQALNPPPEATAGALKNKQIPGEGS